MFPEIIYEIEKDGIHTVHPLQLGGMSVLYYDPEYPEFIWDYLGIDPPEYSGELYLDDLSPKELRGARLIA